jgi:hypothetical protein
VVHAVEPPEVTIRYAHRVPAASLVAVAVAVNAYALVPEYFFCTRIL